MVNTRPGYWDVDRCAWVGVDPDHVVPPLVALPLAERVPDQRPATDQTPEAVTSSAEAR